jgi:hypothetical protein
MSFKEVQSRAIEAIQKGLIQHEARPGINEKTAPR